MHDHDLEQSGGSSSMHSRHRQRSDDRDKSPKDPAEWGRNPSSEDVGPHPGGYEDRPSTNLAENRLGFRERTRHFTFTWFTLTMSTAGVAHVLHSVPLQFHGLYAIGCIFFIANLVFFLLSCIMMGLRFYWWPATFRAAFLHPTESLFIPAFVITIASILVNITEYGLNTGKSGPWLVTTMTVFYWLYVVLAFVSSLGMYLIIWSTQTFTLARMTPVWIFPAYPLLLVGPLAGVLCTSMGVRGLPALDIIVGGFIVQGTGFLLSLLVYSAYLYRLMTYRLPTESSRPAMFVSVGPSAFTVSGLLNMAYHFPSTVPDGFMGGGPLVAQVTRIVAYWAGLWLYGLAVWFFFVSAFAHWSCVGGHRLAFAMTWYAFLFPNTALVTATFNVAKVLGDNFALEVVGCVMTCLLVAAYLFVFVLNVRAVWLRQILWPQKGEDSDEHIWERDLMRRQTRDLMRRQTRDLMRRQTRDLGVEMEEEEEGVGEGREEQHRMTDGEARPSRSQTQL